MLNINKKLYAYFGNFNFLYNLLEKNSLPNSMLISGEKGSGKTTFLLHFLIFSQLNKEDKENYLKYFSFKDSALLNGAAIEKLQNIKIIKKLDSLKNISVDQIRNLISFCSLESFDDNPRFIFINNIEDLSISAANALLKILEQTPKNTYFFLEKDSDKSITKTISSRCFKLTLKTNFQENAEIFKKLLFDHDLVSFCNDEIFNRFDTAGSKINRLFYLKEHSLENLSIKEIAIYCLSDFKKNKNQKSLGYGVEFSKNFFLNAYKKKFKSSNGMYNNFMIKIEESFKYNSDISSAISIIKQVALK